MLSTLVLSINFSEAQAIGFSCGDRDHEATNCFADVAWPGGVDGAKTDVTIVPMTSTDNNITANFLWLKDTTGGVFPYFNWFETGYYATGSSGYFQYYFADIDGSLKDANGNSIPQIDFINNIFGNNQYDIGSTLHIEVDHPHGSKAGLLYFTLITPI
jgi:hypothetical protein